MKIMFFRNNLGSKKRDYFLLIMGLIFITVGGVLLYKGTQATINRTLIPVTFTKTRTVGLRLVEGTTETTKETLITGFQYSLFALSFMIAGLFMVFNYIGTKKLILISRGLLFISIGAYWLSVRKQVDDRIYNYIFSFFTFLGLIMIIGTILPKKKVYKMPTKRLESKK